MPKTIVIFNTKGGVGKTLIAANLAVGLGKLELKRVCLVDLDLQGAGDITRMLNLKPKKAIVDLTGGDFSKEEFLFTDKALKIDFLPAVLSPRQAPYLEPEKIKAAFNLLEKDYDYIIVDAGKSFNDVFITSLNYANLILLVVMPDVLSVHQTKWALETLQSLLFPLAMFRIVLNRAESASSINWKDVERSLPVDIIARIPSEGKAVGEAVNRGVPIVLDAPKAKISQAIKKFSHQLATDESLFIEHTGLDQLKIKEMAIEKTGGFWQREKLAQAPIFASEVEEKVDRTILLKRRLHNRLIEELNLKRVELKVFNDAQRIKVLKDKAETVIINSLAEETGTFISSPAERKKLVKEILDEALGLGPLEDLLADPAITDIMVNNKDEVYIERNGKIELTGKKFISNDQVRVIIERIIAPIGRRIDESTPMVDARLADGSRINAIIPPLSLTGPTLTIRKFRKEVFTTEELLGLDTLSSSMAEFLRACVASRKNIIVSGGTGSGKTTILNVLSRFIPGNERIVTIEDAAELKLHQEHWVRLESRPPNIEGKGALTIRDLFRNTLRMRPDRVIIGECRGIETLDMLQAMNTGHDGSMTTVHANATQDVLTRLDSMILMSGIELPIRAIREMIASAIDLIVHTARLPDGKRKIVQITEVAGMKDELHIGLCDIFVFKQTGVSASGDVLGTFQATGYLPTFLGEMETRGVLVSKDIFKSP